MNDHIALSSALPEITAELFTQATAVIGIRGSGKTNDGVLIAEQAIRHIVPVVVIDPTGVWWGLKSSADGKSAGLPVYVFGGAHADVPLDPNAGALLARFVVERRVPIILDLSDFSKGHQRRFVALFAETLYDLKARNREPLLVVIDEAARFVPQTLARGDVALATCVGAVEDIVALGRSRGLGCVLIGQRPATINKNVLTQADTLIAMRTVGTQDRKALDEWITEAQGEQQQRDELVQNVASLQQGEGYFWSPAIFGVFRRVKFAVRTTFDSSRTPKIGEKIAAPTAFAAVDLEALTAELTATVEQAKADDPKALRARIAELEKRPAVANDHQACLVEAVKLRQRAIAAEAQRDKLAEIASDLATAARTSTRGIMLSVEGLTRDIQRISDGLEAVTTSEPNTRDAMMGQMLAPAPEPVATATQRTSRPADGSVEPGNLGGGPTKMLEALAGYRDGRATRVQLGMLAGFSPSGGTFAKYLSILRTADLVRGDGSTLEITSLGVARVRGTTHAVTTSEVQGIWRGKLGGGPRKMLDALIAVYPKGLSRAELGARTAFEPSGGTFAKYLSTLRTGDLIEVRGSTIVASDALFPTGKLL